MHGIRDMAKRPGKKDLWSHDFSNIIHNTNTNSGLLLRTHRLGFNRSNIRETRNKTR